MAPNVWPDRPEGFRETFLALFDALDAAGLKLLSGIARHLGLAPDWFEHAVADTRRLPLSTESRDIYTRIITY